MNRVYILVFDRDDNIDYKDFHNKLIKLNEIDTWWHYLKSCYILITKDISVQELNKKIRSIIPNKNILLMEVNSKNVDGWLPKEAWEWILKVNSDKYLDDIFGK